MSNLKKDPYGEIHAPIVTSADGYKGLISGLQQGIFWVDINSDASLDEKVSNEIFHLFDSIQENPNFNNHRFNEKKTPFIQALLHAKSSGIYYFERQHFSTIGVFNANSELSNDNFVDSCADILQIDPLKVIISSMQQHIEKVFEVIENMHYVEKGTYFKPADHSRGVSIHRIKTQIGDTEQMGAEEHFDFITANVLFYNYSEGFKVYQDNQWKRLQPPPHPMILFNLGSVLCMRSNQKIRALFHRVDTPSYAVGKPDRLAVLISVIPGLQEIIKPHSSFGPSIYKPHTFEEHILYGASMYTTLSEHVKYIPDGAKVIGVDIKKVQALGCLYSCLFRNPCFSLLGNNTSTIKNTNDSNSLPITNEPYVAFSRLNHEESFLIDFDGVRIIVNPCLSDEIPRKYAPVSVAAVSTRSIHGIIVSSPLPEYFDLLTLEEFNDDIPIYATNEVKILLDDYFSKRKSKKVIEINANGVVINNTVTIYNLSTTFGIKQSGILFSSSIKTLYLPNGLHVSQIQSFYDKLGTDCTFDLILLKASSSCSVRGIDRSFNLLDNSKVISKLKPRKVINLHSEMNLGTGLFVPPRSNEDVNIKDITKVESFEVIEVNDYNEQILFGAMSVKCNPKTRIYGK